MGATQSITDSPIDIVNKVVTEVTTSVLNKNQTTTSGDQKIKISCSDVAHIAATKACSDDSKHREAMILSLINSGTEAGAALALKLSEKPAPDTCYMCSADNINQDMNIAVNISAINDNTIANQIQAELSSKLKSEVENTTKGGIGLTSSQVNAAASLKNYVENRFDTNVVNETINTFSFSQTVDSSNMRVSNINQVLVASAVASAIINNAIKSDASVATAIDAIATTKSTTTGTNPFDIFGGIGAMFAMIAAAIGAIMILGILGKVVFNTGGARQSYAPSQQLQPPPLQGYELPQLSPQTYGQLQGYLQQGYGQLQGYLSKRY